MVQDEREWPDDDSVIDNEDEIKDSKPASKSKYDDLFNKDEGVALDDTDDEIVDNDEADVKTSNGVTTVEKDGIKVAATGIDADGERKRKEKEE